MPPSRHLPGIRPIAASLLAAALVATAAAASVAAKEGLTIVFDAPIGMGTPAGTELLVGLTATAHDEDGDHPVIGSPIVLILTGRGGTETEAHGVEDPPGSGHYVTRITVPPGGAREARVVMRGMGSDGPVDIELMLMSDPFTFGGVAASTAQVAPAPTPALTPLPRATTAPAPAAAAPATAAVPTAGNPAGAAAAGATPDTGTWWLPALVLAGLGIAVIVVIRLRSARRPAEGT